MKLPEHFGAKQLGIILLVFSVLLFLVFFSSTNAIMEAQKDQCGDVCEHNASETCPHSNNIPIQSYAGFTIVLILFGIGVFAILTAGKYKEAINEQEKYPESTQENKPEINMDNLDSEEKKIVELIRENSGAVFQSELVEKMESSKVKVTRLLDRLEGKGFIERRRRGMTNLVILRR